MCTVYHKFAYNSNFAQGLIGGTIKVGKATIDKTPELYYNK